MVFVGVAVWDTRTTKLCLDHRVVWWIELECHCVADRYVCQLLWCELEATTPNFDEMILWLARRA